MTQKRDVAPRPTALLILLALTCFSLSLFAGPFSLQADGPRYLKYNIHAQEGPKDSKASYANWTNPGAGHFIIPANTRIETKPFKRGFIITDLGKNKEIFFEYNERSMKMSADDYIKLITSADPVSLDGFAALDKKGIQEGKAYPGMTKKGVMTALGYPCAVATASPEENTWVYWRNRFTKTTVEFDGKGLVKDIK